MKNTLSALALILAVPLLAGAQPPSGWLAMRTPARLTTRPARAAAQPRPAPATLRSAPRPASHGQPLSPAKPRRQTTGDFPPRI